MTELLFTIRTANRAPKKNYLSETVNSLVQQGMSPTAIHIVPTDPNVRWMERQLGNLQVHIHRPESPRKPNENGLAQVDLLERFPAEWIVMTEDDLEWCHNPVESLIAWLLKHATPERLFYRFFAFGNLRPAGPDASETPLREQKGSQVVAMRAADARRFSIWARRHSKDWRPKDAPFQDRPNDGFDKLLGYWALAENPKVTTGLVSRPFFVRHLGVESAIHSHGLRRDALFGGVNWAYQGH